MVFPMCDPHRGNTEGTLSSSRRWSSESKIGGPQESSLPRQPAVVDTMAELVAAVTELLRPDQAERRYDEAVAVAVEKCAADTAGQT